MLELLKALGDRYEQLRVAGPVRSRAQSLSKVSAKIGHKTELLTFNEKVIDGPNIKSERFLLSAEQTKNIENIRNEEIPDDIKALHLIEVLRPDFNRLKYVLAGRGSRP